MPDSNNENVALSFDMFDVISIVSCSCEPIHPMAVSLVVASEFLTRSTRVLSLLLGESVTTYKCSNFRSMARHFQQRITIVSARPVTSPVT
jgi:hypothetical protein